MELFGLNFKEILIHSSAFIAFVIIFAESSLVFFLPGDSFIFAAGIVASQGFLNLWEVLILMTAGAILGNNFGYFLGRRFGTRLFKRKNTLLFNEENLEKTKNFYAKHGPITIIIARFTPVVRTFAPVFAGIGDMKYSVFLTYNIIGAVLWVLGLGLIGYYAGLKIPNIDHYILPIIIVIVGLSVLPGLVAVVRNRFQKLRS